MKTNWWDNYSIERDPVNQTVRAQFPHVNRNLFFQLVYKAGMSDSNALMRLLLNLVTELDHYENENRKLRRFLLFAGILLIGNGVLLLMFIILYGTR